MAPHGGWGGECGRRRFVVSVCMLRLAHITHINFSTRTHTHSLSQVDVVVPNTHYTHPCFVWPGFVHGRVWGKGCVGGGGARCRGDTAITRVSLFVVGWSCPDGWALNVFVWLGGWARLGVGEGGASGLGLATRSGRKQKRLPRTRDDTRSVGVLVRVKTGPSKALADNEPHSGTVSDLLLHQKCNGPCSKGDLE